MAHTSTAAGIDYFSNICLSEKWYMFYLGGRGLIFE
jgi:hypothetical protein